MCDLYKLDIHVQFSSNLYEITGLYYIISKNNVLRFPQRKPDGKAWTPMKTKIPLPQRANLQFLRGQRKKVKQTLSSLASKSRAKYARLAFPILPAGHDDMFLCGRVFAFGEV